jgi:hypothetical protein
MNTKKMAVLAMVLGLMMVWTASAYGAPVLYTCKVVNAGMVTRESDGVTAVSPPQARFKLTRVTGTPTFTTLVGKAVAGQEKQMLATALTALVNARNVEVMLDAATTQPVTIFNMQIK